MEKRMLTENEIRKILEEGRNYLFREGYCFLCGEKCENSESGIMHRSCAIAYEDIKDKIVERIFEESKTWAGLNGKK